MLRSMLALGPLWLAAAGANGQASSSLGTGATAETLGRGGAAIAATGSVVDAMDFNPAALAGLHVPVVEGNGAGLLASGSFRNVVDSHGQLADRPAVFPFAGVALPLRGIFPAGRGQAKVQGDRWTTAFAITPDMLMRVEWHYSDPPGTKGVSYGSQKNESEIIAIRSAAGLGYQASSKWSVGATVGLVDNRNTLEAPYIFQQQPQLAGLKVILDLKTGGFGWNGSAGAQWQPQRHLRVGASWKSGTVIATRGHAFGTASALFTALGVAADPAFSYRAEVDNHLPQSAGAGLVWTPTSHQRWNLDGNWTGWHQAFHRLPVNLSQGTNATINSLLNSTTLRDGIALGWHNQEAIHAGVEIPFAESWTLRGGYAFQSNPVPDATLTPMTAAIFEHALAAGAGWKHGPWTWSGAYQVQLPAATSVGESSLLAGEYSHSHVQVMAQSLVLSGRFTF